MKEKKERKCCLENRIKQKHGCKRVTIKQARWNKSGKKREKKEAKEKNLKEVRKREIESEGK